MTYRTLVLTALFFGIPFISSAQMPSVILSEIAWMGTDADANNEWIELYNFGPPTDISGWTIYLNDSPFITLSGELPGPHRVSLLERTDDTTLPDVTAFLIYTGALSNDEGILTLRDQSGNTIDTASGGSGWSGIGGSNNTPKKTAQRTNSLTWVTAAPTPGAANAQVNDPVATTTTENTSNTQTTSSSNNSTQRSGGGGSSRKSTELAAKKNEPPVLTLSINGPKTAYVNQEVSFEAMPTGVGTTIARSLAYQWNFGDTYTGKGKIVKHVFEYPGEYVIVAEGTFAKQRAMVRQEVKVLPVSFTLSRNERGDIEVKNNANYETDLGGFTLRGGVTPFTFPKYTFVKANSTIVIPAKRIGVTSSLALHDAQGVSVFALGSVPEPRRQIAVSNESPVVVETEVSDEPIVSAESTVIRIGDTPAAKERGFFSSFFARIARIFGS